MIRRRALAASIEIKIGRNTFRATGITAYLDDRGSRSRSRWVRMSRPSPPVSVIRRNDASGQAR
jgi:hypothetical protein